MPFNCQGAGLDLLPELRLGNIIVPRNPKDDLSPVPPLPANAPLLLAQPDMNDLQQFPGQLWYWAANLLRASYAKDAGAFMQQLLQVVYRQSDITMSFTPNNGTAVLGTTWVQTPRLDLCILSGTDSADLLQQQVVGPTLPLQTNAGLTSVALWWTFGQACIAGMPPAIRGSGKQLLVIGHSLGAVTGYLAAAFLVSTDLNFALKPIGFITLGSPKPGDQAVADVIADNANSNTRIVTAGDNVPYFPPVSSPLLPPLAASLPWVQACNRFKPAGPATLVDMAGNISLLPAGVAGSATWIDSAIALFTGQVTGTAGVHDIRSYTANLRRALTAYANPIDSGWNNTGALDTIAAAMIAANL